MQRKPVTCLNGRFVDAARAAVPVTDRGFRFGDGVFETIRLEKSTPYQWDLHLARLWLSGAPRIPLSSLPVGHKLAVGVSNTLALLEARDHGCDEALQLTLAGELCEAAGANLFWLNHGTLFTPDTATGCLPGTTRDAVLRLSSHPVRRVSAALAELQSAEALFLTNCRVGIWPVASLQPMGWEYDPAHPVLHELTALLERDRAGWNAA